MQLGRAEYRQLHEALVDAFDEQSLRRMLRTELGWRLDVVAARSNFADTVDDVIHAAERQDAVPALIVGAQRAKPSNGKLQALSTLIHSAEVTPTTLSESLENPFGRTGKIDDPLYYFIRETPLRLTCTHLRRGQSVSLVNKSQTGKSSLLLYLRQLGAEVFKATHIVYLSLEQAHNDEQFYEDLCHELGLPPLRGRELWRTLRGKKVVVCLDEMEALNAEDNQFSGRFLRELRGMADGSSALLTFVSASRIPLADILTDARGKTSPFYNIFAPVELPHFSEREAHALVAQYMRGLPCTLDPAIVKRCWEQTDGHPADFQRALFDEFERL